MTVFVCIDDKGGMQFNHRRQSRDRTQLADMLALVGRRRLLCHPYSLSLLEEGGAHPVADAQFLALAQPGDCCFVENLPLLPWADKIKTLVLYRWNRTYPRDLVLDLPLPGAMHLCETVEFAGHAHEKITRERYER